MNRLRSLVCARDGGPGAVGAILTSIATLLALLITLALFCEAARQGAQISEDTSEALALIGRQQVHGAGIPSWFPYHAVDSAYSVYARMGKSLRATGDTLPSNAADSVMDAVFGRFTPHETVLLRGFFLRKLKRHARADSFFKQATTWREYGDRGMRGIAHLYVGLRLAEIGKKWIDTTRQFDSLHRGALAHYRCALDERAKLGQALTLYIKSQQWWSEVKLGMPEEKVSKAGPPWFVWVLFSAGAAASVVHAVLGVCRFRSRPASVATEIGRDATGVSSPAMKIDKKVDQTKLDE